MSSYSHSHELCHPILEAGGLTVSSLRNVILEAAPYTIAAKSRTHTMLWEARSTRQSSWGDFSETFTISTNIVIIWLSGFIFFILFTIHILLVTYSSLLVPINTFSVLTSIISGCRSRTFCNSVLDDKVRIWNLSSK